MWLLPSDLTPRLSLSCSQLTQIIHHRAGMELCPPVPWPFRLWFWYEYHHGGIVHACPVDYLAMGHTGEWCPQIGTRLIIKGTLAITVLDLRVCVLLHHDYLHWLSK